ncbi:MAG: helix-turn-helix domain-containing protein [Candidatus Atabeyarchaeum deiterrae]
MVGRPRELRIEALSPAERAYLLGLYLADGRADVTNLRNDYRGYRVRLFLQWNEEKIGEKVVEMLRRTGLNAHFDRPEQRVDRMVTVLAYSKVLFDFLPNAKALLDDVAVRNTFFEMNRLFEVENAIPFLSGLLDGDGFCGASVRREYGLRSVRKEWYFTQTRYPFLVDYVKCFVVSLAANSVGVAEVSNGGKRVRFRRSGMQALLDAGIAKYSWKIQKMLEVIAAIQRDAERFYTVGEVAKMLGVSPGLVLRWVKTNRLGHLKRSKIALGKTKPDKTHLWHYIPANEVERLREGVTKNREEIERIKKDGMKLLDAARALRISPNTMRGWYRRGELRATLIHEPTWKGRGYLVISKNEVQKLKKRVGWTDD